MIVALAWRNLWRRPRRTVLSVAGLSFAAAFLIFMPSLQNGAYRTMIENTLRLFDGYAQIERPGFHDEPDMRETITGLEDLLGRLRGIDGLDAVSARASAYVLLSADDRSFGAQVLGVEPRTEADVSRIPGDIEQGRFLAPGARDEIALGATLARNLGVEVGDVLTLLGTGFDGSLAVDSLTIVGTYSTGISDIDRQTAEIALTRFQETFTMPDQAHTIVLGGPSLAEFAPLASRIRAVAAPQGLELLEWRSLQPGLWQAIILDASTASLIYVAMIIVVTFSLLNSFLMAVLERTHEFGVLMALGMRPASIGRMVWLETGLMLVLGLGAGIALGYVLTAWFAHAGIEFGQMQEAFGRFGLPGAMYPRIDALTLLAGPAVIAAFTLFAGIFPFLRVYRLQPVAAMRSA